MRIAVIPARGGSKRIPKKNINLFCGKPMIAWSIEAARQTGLFDKVIVSTDHEDIANIAIEYGAEVPFIRPENISDDFVGTNDVVKHAIQWLQNDGYNIDYACCIYATAPFIQIKSLKEGYEKLRLSTKSFSFSVTTFPFPIQRALRINNNEVEALYPKNIFVRSQDFDEAYHDAGQFYWGRPEAFLSDTIMFSEVSIPIIIPRHFVQDIDTVEDWKRAEYMFQVLIQSGEI